MGMQATTIHMARGCVVTTTDTWDHSHMRFTVLFTPYLNNILWREYILKCKHPSPTAGSIGHVVLGHREVLKTRDNFVRMARHVREPVCVECAFHGAHPIHPRVAGSLTILRLTDTSTGGGARNTNDADGSRRIVFVPLAGVRLTPS